MDGIEREFHRSPRGPSPADEDAWSLVFDPLAKRILVRHVWETGAGSGVADWDVTEFLAQEGAAQTALVEFLFRDGEVASTARALGARGGAARAAKMSPARRSDIARRAALSRWTR